MDLRERLLNFADNNGFVTRGPLAMALILTRIIREKGLPVDPEDLLTSRGGQVAGLSGATVAKILEEHGIFRRLASEGGRTSRGSIENMRNYAGFLNDLHAERAIDFEELEGFWIERVKEFFAGLPLELNLDNALSTRAAIRQLADSVADRQQEMPGVTLMGTVLQHLVGAKIDVALGPEVQVEHHGANVSDSSGRSGDFDVGDCAIHVTTAPTEALISKCGENLRNGVLPVIVTARERVDAAEALADNAGLFERVDVMDYEQFLSTNVFEIARFTTNGRVEAFQRIIGRYNELIDEYESDPSLKIRLN